MKRKKYWIYRKDHKYINKKAVEQHMSQKPIARLDKPIKKSSIKSKQSIQSLRKKRTSPIIQ